MWYNRQVNESWPLSQTVKTSPSHGEDMGSIPVGVTTGSFRDEAANLFGPLAQLGERQVRNLEVRGSIPLWSTKEAPHRLGGGVLLWWTVCALEREPPPP